MFPWLPLPVRHLASSDKFLEGPYKPLPAAGEKYLKNYYFSQEMCFASLLWFQLEVHAVVTVYNLKAAKLQFLIFFCRKMATFIIQE